MKKDLKNKQIMKGSIAMLLLLFPCFCFAQDDELQMYYPENELYRKLHVSQVIDISCSPNLIHDYDTMGRETSCYQEGDSSITRFSYILKGDTLVKTHYSTDLKRKDIYEYRWEKFLFNSIGRIIFYSNCIRSFQNQCNDCFTDSFCYNQENTFKCFRKFNLSIDNPTSSEYDKVYIFETGNSFSVKKGLDSTGNMTSIDSFFYNKEGKLTKKIYHLIKGTAGEFRVNNLYKIFLYEYIGNITLIKSVLYSGELTKSNRFETTENIYWDNGLLKEVYLEIEECKELFAEYVYKFRQF